MKRHARRFDIASLLGLTISCQLIFCVSETQAATPRDPTRPGWSAPAANTQSQYSEKKPAAVTHNAINGILFSAQRQLVLFNNHYYRVGDRIGDHVIKRIEPDRIHLVRGEHTLLIQLPRVTSIQPHLSAKP